MNMTSSLAEKYDFQPNKNSQEKNILRIYNNHLYNVVNPRHQIQQRFALSSAGATFTLAEAHPGQQFFRRAKTRKAALQQIESNEGSEC